LNPYREGFPYLQDERRKTIDCADSLHALLEWLDYLCDVTDDPEAQEFRAKYRNFDDESFPDIRIRGVLYTHEPFIVFEKKISFQPHVWAFLQDASATTNIYIQRCLAEDFVCTAATLSSIMYRQTGDYFLSKF
jgi:hypothetical protein